ncbi:MAG TPA: DUF5994 family protein [Nocardioidaceae bacterium]
MMTTKPPFALLEPRIPGPAAAAVAAASGAVVRLSLGAVPDRRSVVDGGWWPRSYDAAAELPGLIAAVDDRLDKATVRVGLSVTAWTNVPHMLPVSARIVPVWRYGSLDPLLVSLTLAKDETIELLVIPPDTPAATANNALALSPASRGRIHPADILTIANDLALAELRQQHRNDQATREDEAGGQPTPAPRRDD